MLGTPRAGGWPGAGAPSLTTTPLLSERSLTGSSPSQQLDDYINAFEGQARSAHTQSLPARTRVAALRMQVRRRAGRTRRRGRFPRASLERRRRATDACQLAELHSYN